jgi:Tfp pilus assembly protein PilX
MKYQSGVVLIISLVMLLLLSIIGISGMAVTILEEAMAANHRDRNLAFQAAEAALRAGERKIEELRANGSGSIQQFCNGSPQEDGSIYQAQPGIYHLVQADKRTSIEADAVCKPCPQDCDIPKIEEIFKLTLNKSIEFDTKNPLLAHQPRYFITYVSKRKAENGIDLPFYTFIITAKGTGMRDTSMVILRSYAGASTTFTNLKPN